VTSQHLFVVVSRRETNAGKATIIVEPFYLFVEIYLFIGFSGFES
jgi:hypothetical protein